MGGRGSGRHRLPRDRQGKTIRSSPVSSPGTGASPAASVSNRRTSPGRGGKELRRRSPAAEEEDSSSSSDGGGDGSSSSSEEERLDEEEGVERSSPIVVRLRMSTLSPLRSDCSEGGGNGASEGKVKGNGVKKANAKTKGEDGDDCDGGEASEDGGGGGGGSNGGADDDNDDDGAAAKAGAPDDRRGQADEDGEGAEDTVGDRKKDAGAEGDGGNEDDDDDGSDAKDKGMTSSDDDDDDIDGVPFESDDDKRQFEGKEEDSGSRAGSANASGDTGKADMANSSDCNGNDDCDGDDDDVNDEASASKKDVSSSPSSDPPPNPYLNKMAQIVTGNHRGIKGRILKLESRGWWTLDAPELVGRKVHNRVCRMIDPVSEVELREYYERTGTKLRYIGRLSTSAGMKKASRDGGVENDDDDEDEHDDDDQDEDGEGNDGDGGNKVQEDLIIESRLRKRHNRGNDGDDGVGGSPSSSTRRIRQRRAASVGNPYAPDWRDSIPPRAAGKRGVFDVPSRALYRRGTPGRDGSHRSLPPVLLSADDDTAVPAALRHLPADFAVDIFDRKSGRILTGDRAVRVRDLPAVLRLHAEYEPVVLPPPQPRHPPAGGPQTAATREGRSGQRVRVGPTVQPQCRVRASAAEGKEVLVTGGPYRGLVGKIEACIPGGWYLVSELLENDDHELELVISSKHLELISGTNEESSKESSRRRKDSDDVTPPAEDAEASFRDMVSKHFVLPIRKLRLRIDALEEERKKLMQDIGIDENEENDADGKDATTESAEKCPAEKSSDSAAAVDGGAKKSSLDTTDDKKKSGGSSSLSGLRLYQAREKLKKIEGKIEQTHADLDSYLRKTSEAKEQSLNAFDEFDVKAP